MGELLRVVRDSHEDFNAVNIATAWSKLAKVAVTGEGQGRARSSDDIANIIQLLSLETPSVAGEKKPQEMSNTLWAIAKLAEKGVEVNLAAVRAVSEQAPRVAGEMVPQEVSNTLWAWGNIAERGIQLTSIIDGSSWRAVFTRAQEVYLTMNTLQKKKIHRAVNIITAASTAEETMSEAHDTRPHPPPERTSAAFWAAAEQWVSTLPDRKRAQLESDLSAAETDDAKRPLLVACAKADTTKVRASDTRTFLKAATTEDAKQ